MRRLISFFAFMSCLLSIASMIAYGFSVDALVAAIWSFIAGVEMFND